ncbi:MAG: gluconate 2-dehydrogenase subunit 3 family protein [Gammaproteobacteria bacterium]
MAGFFVSSGGRFLELTVTAACDSLYKTLPINRIPKTQQKLPYFMFEFPRRGVTRRRFIQFLVSLGTLLPAVALLAVPQGKAGRRVSLRPLGPYLDTLLPDDATPGATKLGVDKALLKQARSMPRFGRLIALGCEWLDKQAKGLGAEDFASLDEDSRAAIVAAAEKSPPKSLEHYFFTSTLNFAFQQYYADPASWQGLGYSGPPQPVGYPDHFQPPKGPGR